MGYGNELRGDDGVGPRVAREVGRLELLEVRAVAVHQLTPELAEPLAAASGAVFVDAALGGAPGTVDVVRCEPAGLGTPVGHVADPEALLALARAVFGRAPPAWLVRVHVCEMAVGERLSAAAERGVAAAIEAVRALMAEAGHSAPPLADD